MKLALFSFHITDEHAVRLEKMVGKPLNESNVCFITTASNPYRDKEDEIPNWLQDTIDELENLFEKVDLFDFTTRSKNFDFVSYFSEYDIVFIGGGNVFYLSYFMMKYGLYDVLNNLINDNSIVYSGGSAGAVILSETIEPYDSIDDPSDAPTQVNEGMNVIEFVPIVHWEDEKYFEKLKTVKDTYEDMGYLTITITDNEALFIEDGKVDKI